MLFNVCVRRCIVVRGRDAQIQLNNLVRQYAPERSLSFMAAAPADQQEPLEAQREEGPDDADVVLAADDPDSHEHVSDAE